MAGRSAMALGALRLGADPEAGRRGEAVARSLGFNDKSNFQRSFKRWTGMTPGLL